MIVDVIRDVDIHVDEPLEYVLVIGQVVSVVYVTLVVSEGEDGPRIVLHFVNRAFYRM